MGKINDFLQKIKDLFMKIFEDPEVQEKLKAAMWELVIKTIKMLFKRDDSGKGNKTDFV